jgi:uncharacterized protein (TIGR02145 family)
MDNLKIDGYYYMTVKIGSQVWLCTNLNSVIDYSWCYDDDEENCRRFGRLYNWETAVDACPEGWRLPSDADWKELEMFFGVSVSEVDSTFRRGTDEGEKMHSMALGLPYGGFVNATDNKYQYHELNSMGLYWSSTESSDSTKAWIRAVYSDDGRVYRDVFGKDRGLSVRCMKD